MKSLCIATKGKIVALGIVIVAVLCLKAFGWHRPYINWLPWDLAQYLVEKGRPASECFDLIWFSILSPTQAEQRALCVYEYAKRKKDPSACELLMPSSYGLYCVGGAEDFYLPCESEKYTVHWNEDHVPHEATLQECETSEIGMSVLGRQCCVVGRTRYILSENDCSPVRENTPIYDRCLYGLAWKNKDPQLCNEITNSNAKAACTVQSAALQKDPSICTSCTPPLNSVDQLPK
jgi:hypothetical protein